MLLEAFGTLFRQAEPPGALIEELIALATASGNEEIQQAFFALGGPPPEFLEQLEAKVKAVGDPSLDTLFENVSGSPEVADFDALFEGLLASMNKILGGVDAEVQRYFEAITPIMQEAEAQVNALNQEVSAPGPESEIGEAKLWFERGIAIKEKLLNSLQIIENIPAKVSEAHNDFLAAETALLEINRRIRDRLGSAGPGFDIAQLASDPELGIAQQGRLSTQASGSCKKLQDAALANGVSADLMCRGIDR